MMKIGYTILILLLSCSAALFAEEDEKFTLAYQFKEKQKFTYDFGLVYKWDPYEVTADNRKEPGIVEKESSRRYSTIFRQTVTGVEEGKATLEMQYLKLKSINKEGKEAYLSSTKAVKNKAFSVSITPDGTMTLVENWKKFGGLSGAVHFAQDLKDFMFRMYPKLPAEPAGAGSTWTHEIKGKDIESKEDIVYTYKILGQEKYLNHRCLKIEVNGIITSEYRYDDPRGSFFAIAKGNGTITGICYFAHVKGLVVGFEGESKKDTVMNTEWVLGNEAGRKQTKELTSYINLSMKLAPPE